MYDFGPTTDQMTGLHKIRHRPSRFASRGFALAKRLFDILFCVLLLPILGAVALFLLLTNKYHNPGPVFYLQRRMGMRCRSFVVVKFRTMTLGGGCRTAKDPLEQDRITAFGAYLRQSRIDELPQIINVLRGEMSLIGPRPDCYDHAVEFLNEVPGYKDRHTVLPGISGFAQTEIGYVEGIGATIRKVEADLHYIANRSFRFEAWIVWRTLVTVLRHAGR